MPCPYGLALYPEGVSNSPILIVVCLQSLAKMLQQLSGCVTSRRRSLVNMYVCDLLRRLGGQVGGQAICPVHSYEKCYNYRKRITAVMVRRWGIEPRSRLSAPCAYLPRWECRLPMSITFCKTAYIASGTAYITPSPPHSLHLLYSPLQ